MLNLFQNNFLMSSKLDIKNISYIASPLGKQHKIFASWKTGGLCNDAHLDSKSKMERHVALPVIILFQMPVSVSNLSSCLCYCQVNLHTDCLCKLAEKCAC